MTPARRTSLLVVALVIGGWLAVGAVTGPLFATISDKQTNDNSAFLPADAEATRAADLQKDFLGGSALPAVVLYEKDSALTDGDLAAIAEDVAEFQRSGDLAGDVIGPIPSTEDDRAAQVIVPFRADAGSALQGDVDEVRAVVSETEDETGMRGYVTGPGGIITDFIAAFDGLDGTLLVTAGIVVIVILLLVYRSPILWLFPIVGAGLSLSAAIGVVSLLVDNDVVKLNGQSQGILYVLVFGASTDYALLLISRFREELRRHERSTDAMLVALRGSAPAIVASGLTVTIGLLCLLFSELNSNRSLGPVGAVGVVASMAVMLTFLPALLVIVGRRAFWPFVPAFGSPRAEDAGLWARIAALVGRRDRLAWVGSVVVLGLLSIAVVQLKADGISQTDTFTTKPESVIGQEALAEHFPAGSGSPAEVYVAAADLDKAVEVIEATPEVDTAVPFGTPAPRVVDGRVLIQTTLAVPADSERATDAMRQLRERIREVDRDALVGGLTATLVDTQDASKRDQRVIIPIVLVVILAILILLLRAVVAPLLLIATVVLSFLATLGVCALVFNHIFDFPGADPAIPLFAFVFLVALGIDYNIFLMTRVREETVRLGTGPGILAGLAVTGGVITSAGVVLAATFSVLAVLPLVFLVQIGFAVAFGVLLDTLLVRSLLVPALVHDLGPVVWWPSRLAREDEIERRPPVVTTSR